MGFLEVLTIIFILLKVFAVVSWSWWIVFTPMIIAVGIYVVMLVGVLVTWIIAAVNIRKGVKELAELDNFLED